MRIVNALVAVVIGCALAAGCGGKKGTLSVKIVVPANADPFAQAARVHLWAGDPPIADVTAAVTNGKFDAQLQFKPPTSAGVSGAVHVEALDANGAVIARGQSPLLGILPQDEDIAVFVGPVGKMAIVPAALAKPRSGMAAAAMPRLGAAFVGGVTADGTPAPDIEVYQLYTLSMMPGTPLTTARPGAVAAGADRTSDAAGYLLLAGGAASNELGLFDPLGGTQGTWRTAVTDESLRRDAASIALLGDGTLLLSGGSAQGKPLATATIVATAGAIAVTPIAASMATPRAGHTVTPITLQGGAGALLFGGAQAGPAAETYLAASRTFAPAAGVTAPSRTGHAAVARASGEVLILGGAAPDGTVLDSALRVGPDMTGALAATAVDALLSKPRAGHTATRAGSLILVCGGRGPDGKPLATCDVIDDKTLTRTGTLDLAAARADHAAIAIETGVILIAGGVGSDGKPLAQIEAYTL